MLALWKDVCTAVGFVKMYGAAGGGEDRRLSARVRAFLRKAFTRRDTQPDEG